jgi:spore germination protein GerM
MKIKLLTVILACFIFFSCNSNEDKNAETSPEPQETTIDTISAASNEDSAITVTNRPMIWTVDEQTPGTERMKKPEDAKLDTFSSAALVQLLNSNYPDVQMDLVKISHDTMYVKIPDSKKLTQQMGSTGAQDYMASATYTLTEFKNVKYINFNLKEGDHAGPGVFSREDFKTLR